MLRFDPNKMEKLVRSDALLQLVFQDLFEKQKVGNKSYVLEVIFNTYVLEDSIMEDLYLSVR